MVSGIIGVSSPGQLTPGAINYPVIANILQPAPFGRTFFIPQNGFIWDGGKAPADNLNFSFNWSADLGLDADADAIAISTWTVESADISIALSTVDITGTIATALISAGVSGNIYNVTNTITTEFGIELSATFRLFVNSYNR